MKPFFPSFYLEKYVKKEKLQKNCNRNYQEKP